MRILMLLFFMVMTPLTAVAGSPVKPWTEAVTHRGPNFTFKTNLPQPEQTKVWLKIGQLLRDEQKLLSNIFGATEKKALPLRVYLVARPQDYDALKQERAAKGKRPIPELPGAYYDDRTRELFVCFTGYGDEHVLAHEIAHYLIRELYNPNPSWLVDEGLADYIAFKLEKESARTRLAKYLSFIHQSHQRGKRQTWTDVFSDWENYEEAYAHYVRQGRTATFQQFRNKQDHFYLKAWLLISFFVETPDPFFSAFFKRYLALEKQAQAEAPDFMRRYFDRNLSTDQMQQLNQKWGQHALNLSYELV